MVYNLPPLEESHRYGGWLNAFVQTWLGACFRPLDFFYSVGRGVSLSEPLLFGMIMGWVGAFLSSLISLIFNIPMFWFLRAIGGEQVSTAHAMMSQVAWVVVYAFFGWLFALLGISLSGLILHLLLYLLGGASKSLATTCRVIGYAWAPQIFNIVPFVGQLVSFIYIVILEIIGLAHAHETEYWRSAIAVLLPILLGCCCAVVLIGYLAVLFAGLATAPH
ncbi:MAG: YIP1 family protein [Armatimonadota bacterium]|nr:YIP1 family protein [Armatimonadota bacterium]MCX7777120.1 YIP1 family protein [Armatimonadota bacterium]MDW8025167.1 YIP1 family protein [Armatimonadota bacterium]